MYQTISLSHTHTKKKKKKYCARAAYGEAAKVASGEEDGSTGVHGVAVDAEDDLAASGADAGSVVQGVQGYAVCGLTLLEDLEEELLYEGLLGGASRAVAELDCLGHWSPVYGVRCGRYMLLVWWGWYHNSVEECGIFWGCV